MHHQKPKIQAVLNKIFKSQNPKLHDQDHNLCLKLQHKFDLLASYI